jgi:hypothetical protein
MGCSPGSGKESTETIINFKCSIVFNIKLLFGSYKATLALKEALRQMTQNKVHVK